MYYKQFCFYVLLSSTIIFTSEYYPTISLNPKTINPYLLVPLGSRIYIPKKNPLEYIFLSKNNACDSCNKKICYTCGGQSNFKNETNNILIKRKLTKNKNNPKNKSSKNKSPKKRQKKTENYSYIQKNADFLNLLFQMLLISPELPERKNNTMFELRETIIVAYNFLLKKLSPKKNRITYKQLIYTRSNYHKQTITLKKYLKLEPSCSIDLADKKLLKKTKKLYQQYEEKLQNSNDPSSIL